MPQGHNNLDQRVSGYVTDLLETALQVDTHFEEYPVYTFIISGLLNTAFSSKKIIGKVYTKPFNIAYKKKKKLQLSLCFISLPLLLNALFTTHK